MAKMTEPKELLVHELADLLYAERRFLTGTKHMAKETANPKIRKRIEQHVKETETHITRLEKAFESIGEKAKGEKCEAAIGLREEHDSFKSEEKPSKELLEAFDLGSGLRVEHYEIAGYRTAIAVAKALGQQECANILKQNLAEEEDMAAFLEAEAPTALKSLFGSAMG
jgi:ferritin-like metal-binding protein YciE